MGEKQAASLQGGHNLTSQRSLIPGPCLVFSSPPLLVRPSAVRQPRRRLDQGGHAERHRAGGGLPPLFVGGRAAAAVLPDGDQARPGAQEARRLVAR